jgi:hypothetical protein
MVLLYQRIIRNYDRIHENVKSICRHTVRKTWDAFTYHLGVATVNHGTQTY